MHGVLIDCPKCGAKFGECCRTPAGKPRDFHRGRTELKFLGRTDVALYLGLKSIRSLSGVQLPPHDIELNGRKGWLPTTIDEWAAKRPGKGRWGKRTSQPSGEEAETI